MERPEADVAVLIPCLNEARTIGGTVLGFRASLPGARVLVFDNASDDGTAAEAARAGAEVVAVPERGKGHVVRRMFAEIDADIYVVADGDATYDPADAPVLVERLRAGRLDMVVGRRAGLADAAGRPGHALGNRLFNRLFRAMFGPGFRDIFSGYRVFSRRFVKSFPALSTGFETETELSVHAAMLRLPHAEVEVGYRERPEGSASKLSTWRDGLRILMIFGLLMKEVKPFQFFSAAAAVTLGLSLAFMAPVLAEYFATGLVLRFPTWIAATALLMMALLLFVCGVILDSLARSRLEQKRLHSLTIPKLPPLAAGEGAGAARVSRSHDAA
ncbi:MAG TPA: glycosyltransferase family 2 protein [Thermohalobaculum sp.]|nr:glycosyltransferase family 2 protein [Thermohalobaculum sp.]